MSKRGTALLPLEPPIRTLRSFQVVVDSDLAAIYGVTTAALNQAVKRNRRRFPKDFVFQLTTAEFADLKSQSVTSSQGHGGRRTRPWAFTEHGAIMAASLLDSQHVVEMSIFVEVSTKVWNVVLSESEGLPRAKPRGPGRGADGPDAAPLGDWILGPHSHRIDHAASGQGSCHQATALLGQGSTEARPA